MNGTQYLAPNLCNLSDRHQYTVNPLLNPPRPGGGGGANLFQTQLRRGGGGLFNLAKTMVSACHKELEYKVKNLKLNYKKCSKTNPNYQLVNKPSQISPQEVLQDFMID